jgi:hypothetical protein
VRTLHPVGVKERFEASGEYVTLREGVVVRLERWQSHQNPGGDRITRIDTELPDQEAYLLAQALTVPVEGGQRIERIDLRVQAYRQARRALRVSWVFSPTQVDIHYSIDQGARRTVQADLPSGYWPGTMFPALHGPLILLAAASLQPLAVAVPVLPPFSDDLPDDSLIPRLSEIAVQQTGSGELLIGRRTEAVSHWCVQAPEPALSGLFTLDQHGLIHQAQIQTPDGVVAAQLRQFARRPD